MKEKLTLSVEPSVKRTARKISEHSGKSISALFEEFIGGYKYPDAWQPPENSAVNEIFNAVPYELKKNSLDYKKLRSEALAKKYDK